MRHHHGLDAGGRRHAADILRRHVLVFHMADPALLLGRRLFLPGAVTLLHLDHVFDDGDLGDEHVGAFGELLQSFRRPGVAGEDDHPPRRLEAIRVRPVLAVAGAVGREVEVRVLDRGDSHIGVLVHGAGRDIVTAEELAHPGALALRPADLRVRREIGDGALNERLDAAAVDIGGLAALVLPLRVEQRSEPVGVVAVRMRDEHLANLPEVVARLHDAPRGAVTGVDEIERAVHDEEVRRLRAVAGGERAAARAERHHHRAARRRFRLSRLRQAPLGRGENGDANGERDCRFHLVHSGP